MDTTMGPPYYDSNGTRLTDCCQAFSTMHDDILCCKACWHAVVGGQGDGTENKNRTPTEDTTMQAIKTRYKGATDHRGSRIIATAQAGRVTIPWDYGYDMHENHKLAATALCDKLQWTGNLATGCLPSGDFVHVFTTP